MNRLWLIPIALALFGCEQPSNPFNESPRYPKVVCTKAYDTSSPDIVQNCVEWKRTCPTEGWMLTWITAGMYFVCIPNTDFKKESWRILREKRVAEYLQ